MVVTISPYLYLRRVAEKQKDNLSPDLYFVVLELETPFAIRCW